LAVPGGPNGALGRPHAKTTPEEPSTYGRPDSTLGVMPRNRVRLLLVGSALVVALLAAVFALTRIPRPHLSEEQLRDALFTAIQRESPEAFLVTGRLELTTTTRVENSRVLLPGILGLDLGTTRATVRVPGRVSYGFPADSLQPEMVRMLEDGTVEVEIPGLVVHSAEPDLGRLEVETSRGWARLAATTDTVERRAVAIVQGAMRRQAVAHLRSSFQPRINTADALEALLTPVLKGLGMEEPRFRFLLGGDLVTERGGE